MEDRSLGCVLQMRFVDSSNGPLEDDMITLQNKDTQSSPLATIILFYEHALQYDSEFMEHCNSGRMLTAKQSMNKNRKNQQHTNGGGA